MKKIKDKIIIANTVSLVFISFIIILSMTIFLIHTAVETESKEMDKLIPAVVPYYIFQIILVFLLIFIPQLITVPLKWING